MGINLGLVSDIKPEVVNELFILVQPAHLQKLEGRQLEESERDMARADFIRRQLGMD
jgi:protein arginine kinase